MLKKKMIKLLREAKSKFNKSEIRIIEALEEAIKQLEKMPENSVNEKTLAISLLLILHDVLQHLPSIEAIIRIFYSS